MDNRFPPPKAPAASDPWSIEVQSTREDHGTDVHRPIEREVLTLRDLLDKYSVTLGYHNTHLLEVLAVLMTTGKVRVEFRSYRERLQLRDPARMMTRPATVELFNEYLVARKEKKMAAGLDETRRITVQLPRIASTSPLVTPRNAPPLP
jgi:hypothetical protein